MKKPVTLAIVGAGSRGTGYASYATAYPRDARVVGVAEPRTPYREHLRKTHAIPRKQVANDWRALANQPRFADAVIIATQDRMHAEPAEAFAARGYHILLEKPMSPDPAECRRIVKAALDAGVIFAVCHVLRYTRYTRVLKRLLDDGAIGDIVSIQHLEPVGFWHQAHSFVRGNWRNEAESAPMLLAKCCHDVDWLRYLIGAPCKAVSSFGTLKHFRRDQRPAGAANRCLDCKVEASCPYSAKRLYLGLVDKGRRDWPLNVLTPSISRRSITAALRTGPYGRCVYACDNDVVDNQVVNLLYDGDRTASLTMTAFTELRHRCTRIFGTHGELEGRGDAFHLYDFLTGKRRTVPVRTSDSSVLGGHGGGDFGLMQAFVAAIAHDDPTRILSGARETLETHLTVFAAETARRENRVVSLNADPQ